MDLETSTRELDERGRFAPASNEPAPVVPPVSRAAETLPALRRGSGALAGLQSWLPRALPDMPARTAVRKHARGLERLATRAVGALALEIDRGVPFLLVPVFLALGVMVYFGLRSEPNLWVLLAAAIPSGCVAAVVRSRPVAFYVFAAMALVAVGMVFAKVETLRAATRTLGGEITTTVTGRVETIEHLAKGRIRLTMAVTTTDRPTLRYAPQRIRVSARAVPAGLASGSMVTGLVRLQPPSGPVRPGSYDFSFQSYFDGIGATGFFMRGPTLAAAAGVPSMVDAGRVTVENLRMQVAERIRARIGGTEGQIAAALIVGVRAGIPEEVNEALRRAGLYHIISISGLHMALVAGVVMGGMRATFALFPGLAARRPVKKYAALLAILAIAAYLFISGGEVAAQRSFIMLAVMLAAILFDRAALTTRNLAISAIVVIVLAPHEVVGPSFQMSFAATTALVGAYAVWASRDRRDASRPPPSSLLRVAVRQLLAVTVALAVTSLVAGLATTAFGIYHFQRVSPLSLFANLAAMPVVSLIVMPFGVLASLAMPFGWDGPPLAVMGKGIAAMIAVAQWFSERSPVDAVGLIPGGAVICVTVALLIATMATTRLRLAALPFAVAGLLSFPLARTPDILVAEDGALVGVVAPQAALAVNRDRPNAFSTQNWQRAIGATSLLKPEKPGKASNAARSDATQAATASAFAGPNGHNGMADPEPARGAAYPVAGDGAFRCDAESCVAVHASGAVVVHTADPDVARNACAAARVIVLADPTAALTCADPDVLVVSARKLAQAGSAAIFLRGNDGRARADIEYAITHVQRPWHGQRRFSRAARGLAPYAPKSKPTVPAAAPQPPATHGGAMPIRPISSGG